MRKVIAATIVLFCGILVASWCVAEKTNPKMIDVDPAKAAQPQHH